MPWSANPFNANALSWISDNVHTGEAILDVGPGAGFWGESLNSRNYLKVDGLEIFEPYVDRYNLKGIYRDITVGDVKHQSFSDGKYKLVIMSDVLEHLHVEDAQRVLETIQAQGVWCLIGVPFKLPQGPVEVEDLGVNAYEEHLQPDLTHGLMIARYPMLTFLIGNKYFGIYYYVGDRGD